MLFSPGDHLDTTTEFTVILDTTVEEAPPGSSHEADSSMGKPPFHTSPCSPQSRIFNQIGFRSSIDRSSGRECGAIDEESVGGRECGAIDEESVGGRECAPVTVGDTRDNQATFSHTGNSCPNRVITACSCEPGEKDNEMFAMTPSVEDAKPNDRRSPIFSLTSVKPNITGTLKEKNVVEDVLSDFFGASSRSLPKPAQCRKRKSIEIEGNFDEGSEGSRSKGIYISKPLKLSKKNNTKEDVEKFAKTSLDLNEIVYTQSLSTPKIAPTKSILISNKTGESSGKKVKFCEEVREHFTFSEQKSKLKGLPEDRKRKRLLKRVKSDPGLGNIYILNSSKLPSSTRNFKVSEEITACSTNVENRETKHDNNNKEKSSSNVVSNFVGNVQDEDDQFSQVSPSGLKEMCSIAGLDNCSVPVGECWRPCQAGPSPCHSQTGGRNSPHKPAEITPVHTSKPLKKFMYPAAPKSVETTKIFQYDKNIAEKCKLSVLKAVSKQDIVLPMSTINYDNQVDLYFR